MSKEAKSKFAQNLQIRRFIPPELDMIVPIIIRPGPRKSFGKGCGLLSAGVLLGGGKKRDLLPHLLGVFSWLEGRGEKTHKITHFTRSVHAQPHQPQP